MGQFAILGGLIAIAVVFYQYVEAVQALSARGAALATRPGSAPPPPAIALFDSTAPVKTTRLERKPLQAVKVVDDVRLSAH